MEAVYVGGFVLPYNLLHWLPYPAQDLASMSNVSGVGAAGYLASVLVLVACAVFAYRESHQLPARLTAPICVGFAALFAVTGMWMYPFDALDIFDYAMHGRMLAILGANPYVALPAWFPEDPFLPWVGWKTFPSVYGPLWAYVEAVIGWLSGDNLLRAVLLLKGLAAASSLACSLIAYHIARRWAPSQAACAIVLVGWNPLVVLMAGTGHNTLTMMAVFLAGIWLVVRDRPAAGVWLAGVSVLVTAAMAPLVAILAVGELYQRVSSGRSIAKGILAPSAALVATYATLYAPLWVGVDHLGPGLLGGLVAQSPLGLLRELRAPSTGDTAATEEATRLGQALLAAIVGVCMWRARRCRLSAVHALQDASFWIVFGALAWWQPWYVLWFVCLAAIDDRASAPGRCFIASLAGLVAVFDRAFLTQHWLHVDMLDHQLRTVALVFAPPVIWACVAPHVPAAAAFLARRQRLTWAGAAVDQWRRIQSRPSTDIQVIEHPHK